MTRQWKPGDVAKIVVGGSERLAFRRSLYWWDETGSEWDDHEFAIANARPLVVIDDQDNAQIDALCKALVEAMFKAGDRASAANGVHPATVKAALRSLTAEPKPEEPLGLGAVVEDAEGERWVRWQEGPRFWVLNPAKSAARYSDIAAVKVLSEGVTP